MYIIPSAVSTKACTAYCVLFVLIFPTLSSDLQTGIKYTFVMFLGSRIEMFSVDSQSYVSNSSQSVSEIQPMKLHYE